MSNRMIKSRARTSSMQLSECLASLFALELMDPGRRLFLISPWISDMVLLSNRAGQYRALMPNLNTSHLTLSTILGLLDERGVCIRVISRASDQRTEDFLRKLVPSIEHRSSPELHEKGLVTEHMYLRGSMNFTHFGVNVNEESVELTTDRAIVNTALLNAQQRWEELGQ